jgi:predicted RNA-binding protein with PIN domain
MTDHLLIDGWNVCWKIPEIAVKIPGRLREARQAFNSLIKNVLGYRRITYRIIYDGQANLAPAAFPGRETNVQFSKSPENADRLIISILRKQPQPGKWTVITSDRDLARQVKALEAQVLGSDDFIAYLRKRKTREGDRSEGDWPPLSREEIDYWLEKFKKK